ncbi:Protein of unknown function [Gryllus bimaculatus]|nr:Protein of unknown function [Gryllus bimaculatus]
MSGVLPDHDMQGPAEGHRSTGLLFAFGFGAQLPSTLANGTARILGRGASAVSQGDATRRDAPVTAAKRGAAGAAVPALAGSTCP